MDSVRLELRHKLKPFTIIELAILTEEIASSDERSMAEYRITLEYSAMKGGGRGYSTDWRLTAYMTTM